MGIEKLEDMLDRICTEVSLLLSFSTILESSVTKPGNASRYQDIKSVKFQDLVLSALIARDSYKISCIRGFKKQRPIFNLLYDTIILSKKLDVNYSILGTQLLLLPMAYVITEAYDIQSLRISLTQLVKMLDKEDGKWFIKSLKELRPSYLGTLNIMDYRDLEDVQLYRILEFSSRVDSIARNMIMGYKYSFKAYEVLKHCTENFEKCIQIAYLTILSETPDGLLYRKFGGRVALNVSKLASDVLKNMSENKVMEFNKYLVENGYNPGSTADIIASGISLYLIDKWYEKNSSNYKLPLSRGCNRVYQ